MTLGATTPTYDLESEPENFKSVEKITIETLRRQALSFSGEILQVPPVHSAIKQKGRPVYLKARKGENVKLEPRKILIKSFEIQTYKNPVIEFKVICSTGTYLRSLAHDFGQALGCGAYLSSLRRTRIGEVNVEEATSIEGYISQIRG